MTALQTLAVPAITDAERQRRRDAVEHAEASNLMAGIKRDPAATPIFEAFINGEIDLAETGRRIRALPHLSDDANQTLDPEIERRQKILAAIKFVDDVFRLEGMEPTDSIRATDAAVLAGNGTYEESIQELTEYVKKHKTSRGFVYSKAGDLNLV